MESVKSVTETALLFYLAVWTVLLAALTCSHKTGIQYSFPSAHMRTLNVSGRMLPRLVVPSGTNSGATRLISTGQRNHLPGPARWPFMALLFWHRHY